uniref:dual-specificity kinase n=1 Tax=Rhodnius prolixus TaxID=13249 RepID=T1H8Q6_RHOPR
MATKKIISEAVQTVNGWAPSTDRFKGVCVHEGQLHALTEYINGGRLEQIIQDSSIALSYSVRMKIALDIAKGLQYLHSKDIFHRDLTSKNIFVKTIEETGEMTAVVGDFGFAARIPRYGCRLATVGSAYWMSPECIKGQWYDQTSDIFSYGIILCEMIARVEADPDILPRTSNFGLDYIAFTKLCADDTPPDFLKLAFQCCNYDPSQRPSFCEIVTQLESIIWNSKGPKQDGKTESADSASKESSGHNKLGHRRSLSDDSIRVLGETMAQQDAYYKPAAQNPFANIAAFKGGKKIVSHSSSDTGCCTGGGGIVHGGGGGESDDMTAASSADSSTVVAEPVVKPSKILQSLRLGEKLVDKASLLDAIFAGGWCFVNHHDSSSNKNRMNEKEHGSHHQRFTRGTSEIVSSTETPRRKITPVIMPPSLPSSPTFNRRMTSSPVKPHHSLPTYRLRTCSSVDSSPSASRFGKNYLNLLLLRKSNYIIIGSNLTFLDDHVGLPVLRRRGSCESGFFSSVGEDFCLPGNDLIASSVTLSSSSAASSLLLDSGSACCDPGEGGTCTSALYRSGGGGGGHFCLQRRGMYQSCRSDSSEEVSLDGHHMEDRCRSFTNQQAQIHKMVEYFERKGSGVSTENNNSSNCRTVTYPVRDQLRYQLRPTYENRLLRRQQHQHQQQQQQQQHQQQQPSSPASTNSSPSVASTSSGGALSTCSSSSLHSTTSSSTTASPATSGLGGGSGSISGGSSSSGVPVHRLIVCEGA